MKAPFLITDQIRSCEADIWRALAGTMRVALASWQSSVVAPRALERVSQVIEEQVRRTSAEKESH